MCVFLRFVDDLKNVYAAARVALPQLTTDVKQLKDGVSAVKQAKELMPGEHRSLHNKLEAFLLKAEGTVEKLASDKEKMVKGYEKMTEQYGISGKKMQPDEFFGMLQKFADRFKVMVIYCNYLYYIFVFTTKMENQKWKIKNGQLENFSQANVKQIELDADRAAKEEKREAAKAAKLKEFKEKQAALKVGRGRQADMAKEAAAIVARRKSGDIAAPKKASAKSKHKGKSSKREGKAKDDDDDDEAEAVETQGGDDEADDGESAAPASMFESMMTQLQAGEAFASRRKGSRLQKK